ncbi:MAG: hypothetical protein K0Q59_973 [Paenibacillus sp.]|jgi:rod shape-determining protein MreD|nr:hypothetical protein [Paenibacillus sp.]
MRRYRITIGLFLLFLLEGTIIGWMIPPSWQSTTLVAPHVVLVGVLYCALLKNRYQGLGYGLAFGFLQDFMYYGHALGVYSFCMGLVGYMSGLLFRLTSRGMFFCLLAAALGSFVYDSLIFGIYRYFLRVVFIDYHWTFTHQILPSMMITTLVALLMYMPARKWLDEVEPERESEEN